MGFAVSFVGLKNADKARVFERLEATEGGPVEYAFDKPLQWIEVGDWLIVTSTEFEFFSPEKTAALAAGGEAIGCNLESHVMACEAFGVRPDGRTWRLDYDCSKALFEVRTEGEPPLAFAELYARAKDAQAASGDEPVDYVYDVPADVFAAVTGFRYDEDRYGTFHELITPPRPGQWRPGQPPPPGEGLWELLVGLFRRR